MGTKRTERSVFTPEIQREVIFGRTDATMAIPGTDGNSETLEMESFYSSIKLVEDVPNLVTAMLAATFRHLEHAVLTMQTCYGQDIFNY
jgi:hypothetical protein